MYIQVATTKKCHPKRRRSSNRYCIFNYPWNGAPCNRKNHSRFTNSLDLRVEDITSNSALVKYKILAKSAIEGCLLKVYSGSQKDRRTRNVRVQEWGIDGLASSKFYTLLIEVTQEACEQYARSLTTTDTTFRTL
ncbi:MAG: hypothetical protein WB511_04510 [Nitrososphaeraceae archaeon]